MSSKANYLARLDDMLEAIAVIEECAVGLTREKLSNDKKAFYAISRGVEIIGEAAKNIPDEVLARYPEIAWRSVRGMRDVIVHEYARLDPDLVWSVVQDRIPELKAVVMKMLKEGN